MMIHEAQFCIFCQTTAELFVPWPKDTLRILFFLSVYQNYIHHFDLGFCFVLSHQASLSAQVQDCLTAGSWQKPSAPFHSGCYCFSDFNCPLCAFIGGPSGKESSCQCRRRKRHGFDPWVGKILWNRKWQPTPAFLPGESHGQRSLSSYCLLGCKVLDTTAQLTLRLTNTFYQSILVKFIFFIFGHTMQHVGS